MKKFLVSLAMCSLAFGDYYSVVDNHFDGDKVFEFSDGLKIVYKDSKIKLKLPFLDDGVAKSYGYKEYKDKQYPVYNFAYIIKNNVEDEFFLKSKDLEFLVKVKKSKDSLYVFGKKEDVVKYKFVIKKAFKNSKPIKIDNNEIFVKYVDNDGGIVAVDFFDKGLKKLTKIEDKYLKQFLEEKSKRKLKVDKFDFNNQKLYLSYISNSSSSQKRLNITYEMYKGYIKTILTSPISFFDPQNKSDFIEQNVGFLKSYNDLYEIKKVQLIDNSIDTKWIYSKKKNLVILDAMTDGRFERNVISLSKSQLPYGIEGVFYLIHWMDKNNISSKSITFINGSIPFDVTIKQTQKHHYNIQKLGNTIYSFELKDGFITKFSYPKYNMKVVLDAIDNDTTLKNKQFLENFKLEHNIRLIKE